MKGKERKREREKERERVCVCEREREREREGERLCVGAGGHVYTYFVCLRIPVLSHGRRRTMGEENFIGSYAEGPGHS
jgi:hypothetical protein